MHFITSRKTKPLTKSDTSLQTHKPPIDKRDQPLHRAGNRECRDRTIKDLVNSSTQQKNVHTGFTVSPQTKTVYRCNITISNKQQETKLKLSSICATLFPAFTTAISVRWGAARKTVQQKGERDLVRDANAFPSHASPLLDAWKSRGYICAQKISHTIFPQIFLTAACLTFADSSLIPSNSSSVALCTRFRMLNH